jgi:hypothetical protein
MLHKVVQVWRGTQKHRRSVVMCGTVCGARAPIGKPETQENRQQLAAVCWIKHVLNVLHQTMLGIAFTACLKSQGVGLRPVVLLV